MLLPQTQLRCVLLSKGPWCLLTTNEVKAVNLFTPLITQRHIVAEQSLQSLGKREVCFGNEEKGLTPDQISATARGSEQVTEAKRQKRG